MIVHFYFYLELQTKIPLTRMRQGDKIIQCPSNDQIVLKQGIIFD